MAWSKAHPSLLASVSQVITLLVIELYLICAFNPCKARFIVDYAKCLKNILSSG